MSTFLLHRSGKWGAAVAAGWCLVWLSAASAQPQRGRGVILDNDETARFRIAVAAFEQSGRYGSSSLGERFGDYLARDLERENREFEVLDPDGVERRLREYGLYLSEWLSVDQVRQLRAAFHANTLIVGHLNTTSAYARGEVLSLRTGQRLGTADVQAASAHSLNSRAAELARRLSPFIPLEGFITDIDRRGRFEIDLGSRHGLQRGMRLAILRDEGGYYGPTYEQQIGTAQVIRVSSRSAEAEVIDVPYGTPLRPTDRVQVLRDYPYYEPPYRPEPPWQPEPPYRPGPEPPYHPGGLEIHAWLDSSHHHWRPGDRITIHIRGNFDGEVYVFDYRRDSRGREYALGRTTCRAGRDVDISFRTSRDMQLESFLVRGIDRQRRQVETRVVLDLPYGPGPPPRDDDDYPRDDDDYPWDHDKYRPDRDPYRDRLELSMDKRDGATYYAGERFSATYRVPQDCSMELWDYRPDGKRVLLLRNNRAEGGRRYTLTGTVTPPYGREELVLKARLDGRVIEERTTLYVKDRW